MKGLTIILFAMLIFSSSLKSQGYQKVPRLGFYPEEYTRFSNTNWEEMKAIFEAVLAYDNIDSLRNDFQTAKDAWFLFSRISDITWNESQKRMISDYFKGFAFKVLDGQSYLKNINAQNLDTHLTDPVFFPHVAVWTILSIDFNSGCTAVERVLEKTNSNLPYYADLRQKVLHFLSKYFQKDAIKACLKKLLTYNLNTAEQELINEIQFKHEVSQYETVSEAWGFIWGNSNVKAASNIQNFDVWSDWYQHTLLVKAVFPDPDISETLNLVESTTIANKKYLLLYSACFFANDHLSSSKDFSNRIKARLTDLVTAFYQENPAFAQVEEGQVDFLRKTFESFQEK